MLTHMNVRAEKPSTNVMDGLKIIKKGITNPGRAIRMASIAVSIGFDPLMGAAAYAARATGGVIEERTP
tara:strand:+ start:431 stop:637 length:207 start_codon:yes stop_codon:yes gene_type:complete